MVVSKWLIAHFLHKSHLQWGWQGGTLRLVNWQTDSQTHKLTNWQAVGRRTGEQTDTRRHTTNTHACIVIAVV